MDIRRGIIRAFDSGTYLADVQMVGSMATVLTGVPVAKQIGADLLTSGTKCGVLFFDETNPSDACVVFVYDGAPAAWITSALIKDGEISEGDLAFNPAIVDAAETIGGNWTHSGWLKATDFFGFGGYAQVAISGGVITATRSWMRVDTEGGAASDDLDTINGGSAGDILILTSVDSARDVVVKDQTGNLFLAGDFTLGSMVDTIMLIKYGSYWFELSRSDNA